MSKGKSLLITGIAAILLFCVLYLSNSYAIRWFNTFQSIFATYGYIQAIWVFYNWLRVPSYERDPKHVDTDIASGKTIPDSWINPFKKAKEDKTNGADPANNRAAQRGLLHAGDQTDKSRPVSGRPVVSIRTSDGKSAGESVAQDSTAAG